MEKRITFKLYLLTTLTGFFFQDKNHEVFTVISSKDFVALSTTLWLDQHYDFSPSFFNIAILIKWLMDPKQ